MIRLGEITLPDRDFTVQTATLEARSKVRKEIRLRGLIRGANLDEFQQRVESFRGAVEAFDRGEADLSLETGRFYLGRRRSFSIEPNLQARVAAVDLLIWTDDRYVRGETLFRIPARMYAGSAVIELFSQGNAEGWPRVIVITKTELQSLTIDSGRERFILTRTIGAEVETVIDSEKRTVTCGGENVFAACNETFPLSRPGANRFSVSADPSNAEADVVLEHRDVWA
ncbi:MAG: hypothetical protein GC154_12565 [bacterium]|nr:hypothetical protein [bacterium]